MENFGQVLDRVRSTRCYLSAYFGSIVNPTFYRNTVKNFKASS